MPAVASTSAFESGLWRAVEVFRGLALVYAAVMVWIGQGHMSRPWVAWTTLAVLALWSGWVAATSRRDAAAVVTELVLACAGILLTRAAHLPDAIAAGATTIPAMFPSATAVAATLVGGLRGGLVAATAITVANLVEVVRPTGATIYNTLLLYGCIACIGLSVELGRRSEAVLADAMRARAETAERERLARVVHDGVLQTLAYVHRRADQLGGPAVELGDLAAASERELRLLITTGQTAGGRSTSVAPRSVAPVDRSQPVDLRDAVWGLTGPAVTVAAPATPVLVPADRADELVAAVRACLDNAEQHAGPGAQAWVLLEDLGDTVDVTVRDDGVGIPPGRLEEAAEQGRLGVASSIQGRLADLGGGATYRGGPGRGTIVHLSMPVAPPSGERP